MASNTPRLGLLKKDPVADGNDTFNLKTMLNDNWDEIDKRTALIDPTTGKLLPGQENAVEVDISGLATKEELQAVEEELTTHKADYMYQIPTIVGSQIRINRLSDTNRLFFKLENDLTGDITISTDNGSTEKPLVDIDQNQMTQIEKGFVEVVADADFFILRNRGISGADKQALIDIVNEAERNESDLKSQFADAVNTVDTDGGINLPANAAWAEILAEVPNIKTGRRWSTGDISTKVGVGQIRGLDFKPSAIVVYGMLNSTQFGFGTYFPEIGIARYYSQSGGNLSIYSPVIYEDGFDIMATIKTDIKWVAFE